MGPNTMTFQVDVFNIFDAATVTETSEINDYSRGTTTVGQPGRLSLNFGNPTSFQPPRSVRLSMRYEF
jgi:outer membrane receptor protein involved in Fe transport